MDKCIPPKMPQIFQNIFTAHFPEPKTPKNDTREEEKQEARQKPKKRRDDE